MEMPERFSPRRALRLFSVLGLALGFVLFFFLKGFLRVSVSPWWIMIFGCGSAVLRLSAESAAIIFQSAFPNLPPHR
jgi:hypothetical protein